MACEGLSDGPHSLRISTAPPCQGLAPLAFQGLSRGFDLLMPAYDSPRGAPQPDMAYAHSGSSEKQLFPRQTDPYRLSA